MIYYLDVRHKNWPAQERLCRSLGVSYSRIKGNGTVFTLKKAIMTYLAKKPLGWHLLFSVLDEYWECIIQLRILEKEAVKVNNDRNRYMIEQILRQAGQNLIHESPADWPELVGLYCQKLVHLRYYEEFADLMKSYGSGSLQ